MDADATAPRCTCCHHPLFADELGRTACLRCQQRADDHLAALPGPDGLYARLTGALAPGRGAGGPAVSGSRTAPIPARLEPLSLLARGGVVTILQTWQADWHDHLGWSHPCWSGGMQQQLDQVVAGLRANLPWAAASHPAFGEFYGEVRHLAAACRGQITGERPERRVAVACPCGAELHITLSTPGRRCGSCGTQYGFAELRSLPLAERRAA
ncbi:hypothetical protein ACLIYM_25340 [Streptomyces fenghuangensis]